MLIHDDCVLLGLNDRHVWELPGGQLDEGEALHQAVVREFAEETGLTVTAGEVVLAEVFEVVPGRRVLLIAFLCSAQNLQDARITPSVEHHKMAWIPVEELGRLPIPKIYQQAVAATTQFWSEPRGATVSGNALRQAGSGLRA